MSLQLLSKPNRWTLALIVAATTITGGIIYYGVSQVRRLDKPSEISIPKIQRVVALGRLEPEQEVVKLSVPAALNNDRVAQLLVKRGDSVSANQLVAVLDSREQLQNALLEAQEQVKVFQSRLAQVKAGAKPGEIAAQTAQIATLQAELQGEENTQAATIARRQSELNNARAEYKRYSALYRQGVISASNLDQRRLALETAQTQLREANANQNRTSDSLRAQIQEAKAKLRQIVEVRSTDVQAAQAEVDRAIAAVKRAEAELKQAEVRSPMAGQILEIYAKPGEIVGEKGIADLGQTERMRVVAEVYQSDISKIYKGQQATITGEPFAGELHGTVNEIGLQVSQQETFSNQPGENLDQRVIKIRIHLNPEDSKRVARLTNLQVQVTIQP